MPINFFEASCITESYKIEFGLCDDVPNSPAYIDETDNSKWIGIVNNPNKKHAEFFAVDNCVNIIRPDGTQESRCDGILRESTNLIFVELKTREGGQWFKKGRKQLTITINTFKANHDVTNYTSITAHVCNNLRPHSHSGRASNIQQFFTDTGGYILNDKQEITI